MSAPVTLHGRLGADPELKFTPSGMAVTKLRIVTNQRRQVDGEWVDVDTTWWDVTCFKQLAENAAESFMKGDALIVVGTMKSRSWETPQGEKRTAFEVTADHLGPDLARCIAKPTRDKPKVSGSFEQPNPWETPSPLDAMPF